MKLETNNHVLLSGAVVGDVFHLPGRLLRFTLAGEAYKLLNPSEQAIYYQGVVVPGRAADEAAQVVRRGGTYLVQGLLEERNRHHQIKTFAVTPIHRHLEEEGGGVDARGQRRLTDGLSLIQVIGNIGSAARTSSRGGTLVARTSVATHVHSRAGDEWVTQTHWVPVMAEGDLAESLLTAERGSRVVAAGNLITERFERDKQGGADGEKETVRRSVALLSLLDYVGESADQAHRQHGEGDMPHTPAEEAAEHQDDPDAPALD